MRLRSLWWSAQFVRHASDRFLHPLRRRRALEVLRALGAAESVTFVCYGNICRSPYAAEAFRRALPDRLRAECVIASAGFFGHGRPSPEPAVKVAFTRGIDLTDHRSTLLTPQNAAGVKLIVVMSREQKRTVSAQHRRNPDSVLVLGDLDPLPIATRTIPDPYGRPEEVFDASYARIDRCIAMLVDALTARDAASRVPRVVAGAGSHEASHPVPEANRTRPPATGMPRGRRRKKPAGVNLPQDSPDPQ